MSNFTNTADNITGLAYTGLEVGLALGVMNFIGNMAQPYTKPKKGKKKKQNYDDIWNMDFGW